jgi:hypothetical protein
MKFILYRILLNPLVYLIVTILLILSIRLVFVINIIPTVLAEGLDSETIRKIQDIYAVTVSETPEQTSADIIRYNKEYAITKQAYNKSQLEQASIDLNANKHDEFLEQATNKGKGKEKEVIAASSNTMSVPLPKPTIVEPVPEVKSTLVENVSSTSNKTDGYYYTSLKDIVSTRGMMQEFGEKAMLVLHKLNDIEEKNYPWNSPKLRQALDRILPAISTSTNYYDDFNSNIQGENYKLIYDLDVLAKNTNNPILQMFVCKYHANCYIYTQLKHNRLVDPQVAESVYNRLMQERYLNIKR